MPGTEMGEGILGRARIMEMLSSGHLFISPLPPDDAVGRGTVDLRLSTLFMVGKRSARTFISASKPEQGSRLFNEVRVSWDGSIALQPRQMILASTLEYIHLPSGVAGEIYSRSSFARMGLMAALAPWVGPGWKGSPTLEVVNVGDVPIELHPGDPICHILLKKSDDQPGVPSRYQCGTRPYFALAKDEWLAGLDDPHLHE